MIRAFLFLTSRSLRNRFVSRLARLKNVRYLVSFLVAMVYFWFTGFRHLFRANTSFGTAPIPTGDFAVDAGALIVLAMMVLVWALPEQSAGLTFSEAEIQFLFPAPITRRQLLLYKIFRQQPQVLISAALISFFGFRRGNFVGLWIGFVVLSVYFLFASLGRGRLKLSGIGFLIRLPVVALMMIGISWALWTELPNEGLEAVFRGQRGHLDSPLQGPVSAILLFVPRLFSRAVLAPGALELLIACAALLAVGVLVLELAMRINVSFEEASIGASQKLQVRRAKMDQRRVGTSLTFPRIPAPFQLTGRSGPEVAIFWKNLIAGLRIASPWLFIMAAMAIYFVGQSLYVDEQGVHITMAMLAITMAGIFPFLGSRTFAQDMRLDLPRIELLKSYPIAGHRLVAAEIAAPLAFVAAVEIMMLTAAAWTIQLADLPAKLAFFARPELAVVAFLCAIPICAMQLLIQNAVPILLPGWAMRAPDEQRGFAVMGQRILMLAGNLLILAIALLPAAIVLVPALLIAQHWFSGSVGFLVIVTLPSIAILCAEVWLGTRFLGAQFETIDVTNEIDTVPA